ncbi:hypothetical protein HYALB_00000423 [Hymenoscyphus albidus]|uniref:CRIB domain-containing protein n=1 Tax=Hymenoscyphus albidus TaxID=595503 RepID=A0A9N9LG78_9HELO|nr:hypothetical protein HYALB_00000423 [Hymenoscyphus albidus]
MFSFSTTGKAAYPSVYKVSSTKKQNRKGSQDLALAVPNTEQCSSSDSLEPAIDGPPSPERIRAYTEQMRRSSIFGNNSRSDTISSSSASSSFRSRDSTYPSTESVNISRRSSTRSNSNMPISRSERHDSTQIFGSIFSRSGRKSRRENSVSSLGGKEDIFGGNPATERHYGHKPKSSGSHAIGLASKKRQPISGPYNFQHVTHTCQEHLPNLEQTSPRELVSEFSAIKLSQAPTRGELKGIRAEDLHFRNFSSESLNMPPVDDRFVVQLRQKGILRKSLRPTRTPRPISYAKSHENMRVAPPRPPRSPLEPPYPMELPPRVSSRRSSVLFDTFDPSLLTTNERFRKSAPGNIQMASRESLPAEEDQSQSHAITTPGDEAWPVTAAISGSFSTELPNVEEEEEAGSRKSRTSSELRACRSVPSFRTRAPEHMYEPFECRMSAILGQMTLRDGGPVSPGFHFENDSWEQDIDYAYDHEMEAHCDYQWDQYSMGEKTVTAEKPSISSQDQWDMDDQSPRQPNRQPNRQLLPTLELHLEDDQTVYEGRFRPSLLIPSPFDVPELSPMSNISAVSPELRTPQTFTGFTRPSVKRSSSRASSFKESHGFNLSPSLLIPADFQKEMDAAVEDYHHHLGKDSSTSAIIVEQTPYNNSVDESNSSFRSYRPSDFSRGSARSSSHSRLSSNSRLSRDTHQSVDSSSSLPDLIPSSFRKHESVPENSGIKDDATTPQADSYLELTSQKSASESPSLSTTPLNISLPEDKTCLSPVEELQEEQINRQVHGRKVSAPVTSQTVREFTSRPRAGTASNVLGNKKARASYMLFPSS